MRGLSVSVGCEETTMLRGDLSSTEVHHRGIAIGIVLSLSAIAQTQWQFTITPDTFDA